MTIVAVGILFAKGESMKLLLICFLLVSKVYSETQVFEGLAKSEGQIAYLERHTVDYEGKSLVKSVTEYFDANGKTIGTLRTYFTQSMSAPEYVLYDDRQGISMGLNWVEHYPEIFTQDKGKGRVVLKPELGKLREALVSGPGLIYFVGENLEKIISADHLGFKYIIPGRLQIFDFTIKTIAHGSRLAEFEIKMNTWVMNIFGPRIRLIYDVRRKRILFYEGQSILRDPEGNMMSVDIEYKYRSE
jgi:hypothetical protein